ncbi:hypothetical protein MNEG_3718 [Monoraphidium neglectum]|uniref:Protein kinase domain-containing protein n=1 Tax=Monoraphidium neglectum TaxID=145388 RepID=A0A0D2K0U7_9CHLO|nr:hypothetical protein MNEG_3718 [Monoraphidium neglectum]KIZ04238.1 hypothetical protein MNEG_3718 [Monoraphidium neglectum]|eukprot:XP_013903257.1 hypothetical protein MNEG_3718 [Monoraphidium neglectum]
MGQNHSQMLTFEPVVANSAPLQPRALATPAATHTWCALPEPGGDAAGAASALAGADELAAANALAAARAFAAAGASMEAKRAAATAQDDGGREPFGLGPELWDDAPTPELRRIAALASRLCGARAAAIALAGLGGRARVCLCADGAGRAAWPPRGGWEQLAADAWALASGPAAAAPTFILDAAKDSRSSSLPSVLNGHIRFFACAPFFDDNGLWMGAICCCDPEPRAEVGMAHQQALEYFAEQALREVEEQLLPSAAPAAPRAPLGQLGRQPRAAPARGGRRHSISENRASVAPVPLGGRRFSFGEDLSRGSRRMSFGEDCARCAAARRPYICEEWAQYEQEGDNRASSSFSLRSEAAFDSWRLGLPGGPGLCLDSASRRSSFSSYGCSSSSAAVAAALGCGAAVAGSSSGAAGARAARTPRRLSLSGDDAVAQLRLGAVLGAGTFGRVYMGTYHGAPVAVKALDTVTQRDSQSGVALEAELSAALSHPNIVRTLAWHEANGQTWLVLDYADKGTLQAAVDGGAMRGTGGKDRGGAPGGFDLLPVLSTAREIASGMAYLHALGILHCDLTASNVLLSGRAASDTDARGFVAQISDFGLSLVLEEGQESVTASDHGAATAMAPEVLSQRLVSKAADVYSFGVLLWQICTGEQPWRGMTRATLLHAVCVERRRLEFGPASDVPECLQLLAAACMAHDPCDRPTFGDILDILQPLGQLFPGGA